MRRSTLTSRRLRVLALAIALGCLCVLAAGAPHARAVYAAGVGTISGQVVNGTQSNAAEANTTVTLQRTANGTYRDIATTTSNATGHFSFGGLPVGDGSTYAAYVRFEGGLFPSTNVSLQSATATANVTVYDVTHSDAALHVSRVDMLVSKVQQKHGLVSVGEFVTFHNSAKTAFVGTTAAANGKPMGMLRFAVPTGSSNLTLGIGFSGVQTITVGTGFGSAATVQPGDSIFAFEYDVPYTGTTQALTYKAEYTTDLVNALVPPSMYVDSHDFSARGIIDAYGLKYQSFQMKAVKPDALGTLHISGLPVAGEPQYLNVHALAALAGVLALLAALLVWLFVRRGSLAVALHLVAASDFEARHATAADAEPLDAEAQALEAERQDLLAELLALGQQHKRGTLADTEYTSQEAGMRARLRDVISRQTSRQAVARKQLHAPPASGPVASHEAPVSEEARSLQGGRR